MNIMTTNNADPMKASRQWASRPADQRFINLDEMLATVSAQRENSVQRVISSRKLEVCPVEGDESRKSLAIVADGDVTVPTHWSFGQVAQLAKAPAGYLRTLPADIAADALNYGMFKRDVQEVGVLEQKDSSIATLAAATGPNYGRVWNEDVIRALRDTFGNGIDGDFTVPGEFGRAVEVTKANTTLYASDRDMFVFLADEKNKLWVPNRRNGVGGEMARGFFVWNSQVGAQTLGIATFLFDYVCMNRIVWGMKGYEEIKIRHTSGAPDRWLEEAAPAIEAYAEKSTDGIVKAITDAKAARLDPEKVDDFLAKRFTKSQARAIKLAHEAEEERPIESLWDVATGATAYAKSIKHQNDRVDIERKAGKVLALVE